MRILSVLLAARGNPKEPVPFSGDPPVETETRRVGQGQQDFGTVTLCSKEVEAFKKCYTGHLESKRTRKEKEAKGILAPGEKSMSHKQLNMLLKKFPNVK
ncbi:hypothetical protein NQ318_023316 [Aromia moschata]|uniref:Uncharacterized protein n=1 Tax=Aromia moschata TaxID=1265417 RepID=A0AAV8XTE1_9CUCU|nr:hypothetical protein NQ318_023316 [Aromia moschata]